MNRVCSDKNIKVGSKVEAIAGTVAAMWAEGTTGIVVELIDNRDNSGNNLIRWDGGNGTLLGFRIDEVIVSMKHINPNMMGGVDPDEVEAWQL